MACACMDSTVSRSKISPSKPPVENTAAESFSRRQRSYVTGNLTRECALQAEMCKTLWCGRDEVCETKYMPAAEGTSCGVDMVTDRTLARLTVT